MSEEKSYTLEEVAEILGKSRTTIYRLMCYGALLSIKRGRRFEIPESELIRFLKSGQMPIGYTKTEPGNGKQP